MTSLEGAWRLAVAAADPVGWLLIRSLVPSVQWVRRDPDAQVRFYSLSGE
jgi:hypothetical protein